MDLSEPVFAASGISPVVGLGLKLFKTIGVKNDGVSWYRRRFSIDQIRSRDLRVCLTRSKVPIDVGGD